MFCANANPPVPVRVLDLAPDIACVTVRHIDSSRLSVTGKLGEGGYGVVWRADFRWTPDDDDELHRDLAAAEQAALAAASAPAKLSARRTRARKRSEVAKPMGSAMHDQAGSGVSPRDGSGTRRHDGISLRAEGSKTQLPHMLSSKSLLGGRGSTAAAAAGTPPAHLATHSRANQAAASSSSLSSVGESPLNVSDPEFTFDRLPLDHSSSSSSSSFSSISSVSAPNTAVPASALTAEISASTALSRAPTVRRTTCVDLYTSFTPVVVAPTPLMPSGFVLIRRECVLFSWTILFDIHSILLYFGIVISFTFLMSFLQLHSTLPLTVF